jgi:hypothetical protein
MVTTKWPLLYSTTSMSSYTSLKKQTLCDNDIALEPGRPNPESNRPDHQGWYEQVQMETDLCEIFLAYSGRALSQPTRGDEIPFSYHDSLLARAITFYPQRWTQLVLSFSPRGLEGALLLKLNFLRQSSTTYKKNYSISATS